MTATKIWRRSSARFGPAKPGTWKCARSSCASQTARAHAFVVMLAYQIIQYLALCWSPLDVTVEEGLHALTTLCLVAVSPINAPSYHCIPTPRDAIAHLLHRADIKLPKAFPLSGTRVSTKKKLQSERLVQ